MMQYFVQEEQQLLGTRMTGKFQSEGKEQRAVIERSAGIDCGLSQQQSVTVSLIAQNEAAADQQERQLHYFGHMKSLEIKQKMTEMKMKTWESMPCGDGKDAYFETKLQPLMDVVEHMTDRLDEINSSTHTVNPIVFHVLSHSARSMGILPPEANINTNTNSSWK